MSEASCKAYQAFIAMNRPIWEPYDGLGVATREQEPLDQTTRQLAKLSIAVGICLEEDGHSHIRKALDELNTVIQAQGSLCKKIRQLVRLGIAVGACLEGAVRSHTQKALAAGASPDEIRHIVLLATSTIGFPSMMVVLTWVEDELEG